MCPAERFGYAGNLHGIGEDGGNGVGLFGVIAHSHQPDALDEQDLRRMAALADIGLNPILGLGEQGVCVVGIQIDVLRLAIDNHIGCERRSHLFETGCTLRKMEGEVAGRHPERL